VIPHNLSARESHKRPATWPAVLDQFNLHAYAVALEIAVVAPNAHLHAFGRTFFFSARFRHIQQRTFSRPGNPLTSFRETYGSLQVRSMHHRVMNQKIRYRNEGTSTQSLILHFMQLSVKQQNHVGVSIRIRASQYAENIARSLAFFQSRVQLTINKCRL